MKTPRSGKTMEQKPRNDDVYKQATQHRMVAATKCTVEGPWTGRDNVPNDRFTNRIQMYLTSLCNCHDWNVPHLRLSPVFPGCIVTSAQLTHFKGHEFSRVASATPFRPQCMASGLLRQYSAHSLDLVCFQINRSFHQQPSWMHVSTLSVNSLN